MLGLIINGTVGREHTPNHLVFGACLRGALMWRYTVHRDDKGALGGLTLILKVLIFHEVPQRRLSHLITFDVESTVHIVVLDHGGFLGGALELRRRLVPLVAAFTNIMHTMHSR